MSSQCLLSDLMHLFRSLISVIYESTDVLEHILSHEDCDVDPVNRLDKATPLHIAVRIKDAEMRLYICESLLEAGADTSCVLLLHQRPYPDGLDC